MNHAATYHIGNDSPARQQTATAIAPAIGRVLQVDGTGEGCKRNPKRQTEIHTATPVANGFLRTAFLPKLKKKQTVQACKETKKTEKDFYKSLSQLAGHYGIEPMPTQDYGYPYNIALSLWDIQRKLKQKSYNWYNLSLVQERKKTFLTCEERYNTGTTLYYIPVVPLFQMLKDPQHKRVAQLLVSVCSYLYHIADVPYYRQEDSYLYWIYEMLDDWAQQDEQTDATEGYKKELRQAQWVGDCMERRIFNRTNLTVFEARLNAFKCRDDRVMDEFDHACWQLAQDAFALYSDYPHESLFRNARRHRENAQDDDDEYETIGMEKYISFFADCEGWLYDSLSDSISNEFNECGQTEEPLICKHFDGSPITGNDLDFENRLFSLIEELCHLLNNYKRAER